MSVHLHIDKLLPEAEVRCRQPYEGLLTVELKKDAGVRVRIPSFAKAEEMKVEAGKDGRKMEAAVPELAPLQEDDGLIDFWHLK